MDIAVFAGVVSTAIFAGSSLPMLGKALRTRDLRSYSLGNLVMANVGNAVYAVYVFSLPLGPVWALHAFNELVSAFMLVWFLQYERWPRRVQSQGKRRPFDSNGERVDGFDRVRVGG